MSKEAKKEPPSEIQENPVIETNIWDEYETDPNAEENGVWVEGVRPGIDFKIAKLWNKRHTATVKELQKPFRKLLKAGSEIPDDKARALNITALAKTILLDWKGMKDRKGNPLPYSEEAAIEVLTALPAIRNAVMEFANMDETFNKKALEEQRKN